MCENLTENIVLASESGIAVKLSFDAVNISG